MSDATMTTMPSHQAVSITPRNIRFMETMPAAATWLNGDIVGSAVYNALSLTFPDGERMFMDAVRHYKDRVSGPLLEEANAFITQEAIHTREHVALNKMMDPAHYPLERIRAHIREQTAIAERMGPMTMLGATISLEHFTAMLGDSLLRDPNMLDGAPEDARRLWQWHAMEETEHKAVAFDVFQVVTKDWPGWRRYMARVHAMALVSLRFTMHLTYYASLLLAADGMSRRRATFNVLWYLFGKPAFFRKGLRGYWHWYKPGFHPWDHDNRAMLDTWRQVFAPA
jgi:hypothetical protein